MAGKAGNQQEPFLQKAREAIALYGLLEAGDRVLAGFSGGADSTALLLCLDRLGKEMGFSLSAFHANHQLRGRESEEDENFCRELCARLGIPFYSARLKVRQRAEDQGESLEEAARHLRYQAFLRQASQLGCGKAATAHTLSDNVETALFRFCRGTGLKGLCGIPPVRELGEGIQVIRPLLLVSRKEIEAFLQSQRQEYRTDSSNADPAYARNRLRLKVLPELEAVHPGLMETAAGTLQGLAEDSALLEEWADRVFIEAGGPKELRLSRLKQEPGPIQKRCILRLLEQNALPSSRALAERLLDLARDSSPEEALRELSGNWYFRRKKGTLSVVSLPGRRRNQPFVLEETPWREGTFSFLGKKLLSRVLDFRQAAELLRLYGLELPGDVTNIHKKFANGLADYDKIQGNIVLRNRRDGDRIDLPGRDFSSSVRKLQNASVTPELRSRQLLLADQAGVFYLEGFGFSRRVLPDNATKRFLEFTLTGEEDGADGSALCV